MNLIQSHSYECMYYVVLATKVRLRRRMAYIGTILRELQINQYYSNTYACDEAILNMGVQTRPKSALISHSKWA